jgi:hypothetical protein
MALTGLVAFAAGHFSPLRGGSSKNSKELERLYQIISSKNVEVQKLKTMIYEYEYKNQELKQVSTSKPSFASANCLTFPIPQALYESEQESLKRDYEEFKQPDANGDDVISRAEVRQHGRASPVARTTIIPHPHTVPAHAVRNLHKELHEGLPAYSC